MADPSGCRVKKVLVTKVIFQGYPYWPALVVVGLKKEGTYNECDSENVTSDDYPATNVDETDSDHQEDDNLSCRLENEITNEDNSSTVDSSLGLAINKTLDIL